MIAEQVAGACQGSISTVNTGKENGMKTSSARLGAILLLLAVHPIVCAGASRPPKAAGPLRVHPTNPAVLHGWDQERATVR